MIEIVSTGGVVALVWVATRLGDATGIGRG